MSRKTIKPIKIYREERVVKLVGGQLVRIGNIQTENYLREHLGEEVEVEMGHNMKIYYKPQKPVNCKFCGHKFQFGRDDGLIYDDQTNQWIIDCSGCGKLYTEEVE